MTLIKKLLGLLSLTSTTDLQKNEDAKPAIGRSAELRQKLGLPEEKVTSVFGNPQIAGEHATRPTIDKDQSKLRTENELNGDISRLTVQDFLEASRKGETDVITTLLAKGMDVNEAIDGGWSPLMAASEGGHTQLVELLIDKGADIDTTNEYGTSALILASQLGHTGVVERLLNAGAQVNKRNINNVSALMTASGNGFFEVVNALIAKGADVNVKAIDGTTALIVSAGAGHLDILKTLIANGAETNVKNDRGCLH